VNGLRKPKQTPAHPRNGGFTLIELLIVISIIALLIGLLVPAVMSAMRNARDAEVRTEISQLDTAITAFQAGYGGIAPPSSITLHIDQTSWDGDPRSKAIIRRIWPQFDFSGTGGGGWTSAKTLNGAECLVFFLGGVRDSSKALVGFSKNPATPFAPGGNREGPFFEFNLGRLTDADDENGDGDNDPNDLNVAPEYLDPLASQTNPYIYLSSYDGSGYRSADVMELQTITTTTFTSWYTLSGGAAFKPNTHQIISPGADGDYGTGGVYDGNNYIAPSPDDEDNITNFGKGRLTP